MRRELLLLQEMIDAAARAASLVAGVGLVELESDELRSEALLWNFTVLGEASSQLDPAVKGRFPQVDWSRPIALRNRIVHGYWSIDLEILYVTATTQLADFVKALAAVLDEIRAEER